MVSALSLAASIVTSCALPSVTDYADGAKPGSAGTDLGGQTSQAGAANHAGGRSGDSSGGASAGTAMGGGATGGTSAGGAGFAGTGNEAGATCVPEICNGVDDDCDLIIDNGCPAGFLRGAATPGTALGDSTGGTAYSETCANDEVVVGLQVAFSNWLDQVTVKCQQFSLAVDEKIVPYRYSVAFGASHLLAANPTTTNDSLQALNCPTGKVLVGLDIAQQHTSPMFTPDYLVVTQIGATCADLVLDSSSATPQLEWQNPTSIGPLSGTLYASASATPMSLMLPSNQIAVGYQGSAGLWIDRIGPVVSSVQISLQ